MSIRNPKKIIENNAEAFSMRQAVGYDRLRPSVHKNDSQALW